MKKMNELKFNSQICTTKEQSQRLLELGLNPYTSDMCLSISGIPLSLGYIDLEKVAEELKFNIIPSWSLHRLMEIGDIENVGFVDIKNAYETCISIIASHIKFGLLNKEYLKQ